MGLGGKVIQYTITIIYDNYAYDSAFRVGSGFSCLIKGGGKNILFDTGAHGPTLLYNLQQAGTRPEDINTIVLSHIDSDHVGGLFHVLEINRQAEVYVPPSFPEAFKDLIRLHVSKVVEVEQITRIEDNIYVLGEFGIWVKEQPLLLRTEKGVVLITGDAHPGIVSIIKEAQELTGARIHLALGGFHLDGASDSELKSILNDFRQMGVEKVAPCHSSGDSTRALFRRDYGPKYIKCGAGKIFEVPYFQGNSSTPGN